MIMIFTLDSEKWVMVIFSLEVVLTYICVYVHSIESFMCKISNLHETSQIFLCQTHSEILFSYFVTIDCIESAENFETS